jgi:hypothetical protein
MASRCFIVELDVELAFGSRRGQEQGPHPAHLEEGHQTAAHPGCLHGGAELVLASPVPADGHQPSGMGQQ